MFRIDFLKQTLSDLKHTHTHTHCFTGVIIFTRLNDDGLAEISWLEM